MPISRKDFELGNFEKRYHKIGQHPVLLFLEKNKTHAYTTKEITKKVKMKKGTVRDILGKAVKNGLVEHKQPQFIWKIKSKKTSKKKRK